ncbi:hypothetical protein LguiA_000950 [Lonicera macranthoides]
MGARERKSSSNHRATRKFLQEYFTCKLLLLPPIMLHPPKNGNHRLKKAPNISKFGNGLSSIAMVICSS